MIETTMIVARIRQFLNSRVMLVIYSRIFKTATRSSRSSPRLTIRPEMSPVMMVRNAHAMGAWGHDEREAIHLAVQRLNDGGRHSVAQETSDGQRRDRQERELAEQDQRYLGPGKAQHTQAGQFPVAFGKRDARGVVDNAERDDPREEHVEED